MKTKSLLWSCLWFILPILYLKCFTHLALWNDFMSKSNGGYLSFNWFIFTVYIALLAVYLYFFYQTSIEKTPALVSLILTLLYLCLNILPVSLAVPIAKVSPLINFFYEATIEAKSIRVLLFSAYIIKVIRVLVHKSKATTTSAIE